MVAAVKGVWPQRSQKVRHPTAHMSGSGPHPVRERSSWQLISSGAIYLQARSDVQQLSALEGIVTIGARQRRRNRLFPYKS